MTEDLQRRAEALFVELLGLPAAEQQRLLDERCAGDASLRSEVASLLGHHQQAESFLDHREISRLAELEDVTLEPGARIGEYTVQSLLGRGGMGIVYVAEQQRPKRTVAIKLIRRVLAGYAMLRRFEHEAEVLGRLRHPGIAQIYEAGVADCGLGPTPFIAMELVQGPPILAFASVHRLDISARVQLLAKVAHAVHHAHQRGIIHRDLKPANILVDDTGQPKVLDFGVARATDADLQLTTIQTNVGQLVGTLAYMSPEQVLADPREVDTRTDVYALGVILYQLLADRLPLDVSKLPLAEAARVVRDEQPPRLGTINRACRGELETIVAKALDKDKTRRYQSAQALADDLEAFLTGEPIAAKQDSTWYALRVAARRHRGPVVAIALVLLAVVTFASYGTWQAGVQKRLADQEREARKEADLARQSAAARAEELRQNSYVSAIGFAQAAIAANDMDRVRRVLASCPEDLRGWEWNYLTSNVDTSDLTVELPGGTPFRAVCATNGSVVATWRANAFIQLADAMTGEVFRGVDLSQFGPYVVRCEISADGATCIATTDTGWLVQIESQTGKTLGHRLTTEGRCYIVDLSADGTQALVMVNRNRTDANGRTVTDERAELIDVATGQTRRRFDSPLPFSGAISSDGRFVALGLLHQIAVFDLSTDAPAVYVNSHRHQAMDIAFSPDSRFVAVAGFDGFLTTYDIPRRALRRLTVSQNKLWSVAWSPDGTAIAAAGTDAVVSIVLPQLERVERTLVGHATTIDNLSWTTRGFLISGSRDSTFRRWNNPREPHQPTVLPGGPIMSGAWSPRPSLAYLGLTNGRVVELDTATGRVGRTLITQNAAILEIAVSKDGATVAVAAEDGLVATYTAEGVPLATHKFESGRAIDVCFHPDGTRLAVGSDDERVVILDPRTCDRIATLNAFGESGIRLAWSPDGSLLAVAYLSIVRVFDGRTYTLLQELTGPKEWAGQVRFSPDGRHLLVASNDSDIHLWNTADWSPLRPFVGHKGGVFAISVSPDGSRLVSAGWDNTVRIWDYKTRLELLSMRPHKTSVWLAEFSPDGQQVLTGALDETALLWNASRRVTTPIPLASTSP